VGDGQEQRLTVDQTIALPPGDAFRTIGTVRLRRGVGYALEVTNKDTGGFAIVDAFQLLQITTPTK
jgi:hypothetical protein